MDTPFTYDLERMKLAVNSPSREIPDNLTFQEYQEWMMCNEMIENIHASPAFTIEGARETFKDVVISPNVSMEVNPLMTVGEYEVWLDTIRTFEAIHKGDFSVEKSLEAMKHIVVDSDITWPDSDEI